jgi:hypothetical protein
LFLYPTQYFFNALATRNLTVYNMIHKMFKPVNKEAWEMTPPTVNAYYDPTKNQMVLPAGILQSPYFFDETYPMAMNMGGAGNVVGHELSHGMRCERESIVLYRIETLLTSNRVCTTKDSMTKEANTMEPVSCTNGGPPVFDMHSNNVPHVYRICTVNSKCFQECISMAI